MTTRVASTPGRATEMASSTSASAAPLQFRSEVDDLSFPTGGALLLVALLLIAAWAWTAGRRRLDGRHAMSSAFAGWRRIKTGESDEVRLVAAARLDVSTRLHVVEWRGKQMLVGVNGPSAPVLLATRDVSDGPAEGVR